MKIICAGFPKTGTKSMAMALRLEVKVIVTKMENVMFVFSNNEKGLK